MFVHYFDFPPLVFLAHAHGKANTAQGKEGSQHGWLAAGVGLPWGHKHTQHQAAVPPPSHSTMFSSPVLGREVDLGPAASSRLSSGQQSHHSGRGCHKDSAAVFMLGVLSTAAHCAAFCKTALSHGSLVYLSCVFLLFVGPGSSVVWFH